MEWIQGELSELEHNLCIYISLANWLKIAHNRWEKRTQNWEIQWVEGTHQVWFDLKELWALQGCNEASRRLYLRNGCAPEISIVLNWSIQGWIDYGCAPEFSLLLNWSIQPWIDYGCALDIAFQIGSCPLQCQPTLPHWDAWSRAIGTLNTYWIQWSVLRVQ